MPTAYAGPPVYLSERLKCSPNVDGRYLVVGDRIDDLDLDDAYVAQLLASGQATITPPGEPEPTPRGLPDFPPFPEHQPRPPEAGTKATYYDPEAEGIMHHNMRCFQPGARLDEFVPAERLAELVASGRASTSKPKTEGASWKVSVYGADMGGGLVSQPPANLNRTERVLRPRAA